MDLVSTWICPKCGEDNKEQRDTCNICEERRPGLAFENDLFVSITSGSDVFKEARSLHNRACGAARAAPNLSGFGYEVVSSVGSGSHSTKAWLVRQHETGQTFLAKCVSLAELSPHNQELAKQEASLLQVMQHPYIVVCHDSFVIDDQNLLVILMEYCSGGDLRQQLVQKATHGGHFSEDQVMSWFVQIALALQYIHSEKVLHRDIKTSNIFVTEKASTIKLGDFGLSRVLECTLDNAMTMVGTPYYMSPEVCQQQPYSWKSDIWSLGCVLYEVCMLKHAFESKTLLDLASKIIGGDFEPMPQCYSQDLRDLVRQLLMKSADCRPSIDDILSNEYVKRYVEAHHAWCESPTHGSSQPPVVLD